MCGYLIPHISQRQQIIRRTIYGRFYDSTKRPVSKHGGNNSGLLLSLAERDQNNIWLLRGILEQIDGKVSSRSPLSVGRNRSAPYKRHINRMAAWCQRLYKSLRYSMICINKRPYSLNFSMKLNLSHFERGADIGYPLKRPQIDSKRFKV